MSRTVMGAVGKGFGIGEALAQPAGAAAGAQLMTTREFAGKPSRRHNQPKSKGIKDRDVSQEKQLVEENMDTFLAMVNVGPATPSQRGEEELAKDAAYAKEYSRLKMKMHRRHQEVLQMKLRLQHDAIKALPKDLRAAAKAQDLTPFPISRSIPLNTPPSSEEDVQKLKDDKSELMAGGKKRR